MTKHRRINPVRRRKAPHRPERDNAIFEVLHAIKGQSHAEVAARTYVSPATIAAWRNNKTRYPQHHTLAAVAATVGLSYKLVRSNEPLPTPPTKNGK